MKRISIIIAFLIAGTLFSFAQKERKVIIKTNHGKIIMKLYNETPQHRDNFVKLAKDGFYNGTIFHRVIPEFMIQGGDPDSKEAKKGAPLGKGGPGYKIPAEFVEGLVHKKGALAAARQGQGNPEKKSSGSQFYIVVGKQFSDSELDNFEKKSGMKYTDEQREIFKTDGGTPHLDGGYTVFGELVKGMDVIDKIAMMPADGRNRPNEDVIMLKVKVK